MEALMTPNELRTFLKISRSTLARMVDAGLPHVGWGRLRRFDKEAVMVWFGGDGSGTVSATDSCAIP